MSAPLIPEITAGELEHAHWAGRGLGAARGLAWAIAAQIPVWVLIVLIALALT